MSGIKARLFKPTGLEWFEGAFTVAVEVWKFICHEYKNKSSAKNTPEKTNGQRTRADIPKRYWETHAVPLHKLSRKIIRQCRKAYQAYPTDPKALKKRKKHLKKAMDQCFGMYDELRLTLDEMQNLDANKLNNLCDALMNEIEYLKIARRSTRIVGQGEKGNPKEPAPKPQNAG